MLRFFKRFLLLLGALLLLIVLVVGVLYYRAANYPTYSLSVDADRFPDVQTPADIEALASKLVEQMTLNEKVDQLYGEPYANITKLLVGFMIKNRFPHYYVGRNERLGIPPWVLSDGPRGARVLHKDINGVTTFPVAMARGASWDIDLERRIHEVIATEIRANGANYAATPCINLLRHPGWGRAQETYGEDPWLLGEFGVAAVQGIESKGVMACPKHFALNSLDNSRWVVNVDVDERALREVYLPHFKKTIQVGKPASLMSAYNKVRGDYCAENPELLEEILRNEWGFEGFVSSDWLYGVYDGPSAISAGLDVEMPVAQAYHPKKLKKALKEGRIKESDIDRLVLRSLRTRLPYAFQTDQDQYPRSSIGKEEHVDLALEAAEASMVLLKNEELLPLSRAGNKTLAVIGRLANQAVLGDRGSSNCTPQSVVTPYEGIVNYLANSDRKAILQDSGDLEAAKTLASSTDEVILVVGFTYEDEGEYIILDRNKMVESANAGKLVGTKGTGGDRETLRLRPEDEALIQAVTAVNDRVTVVFIGGSAINLSAWEDQASAILFAWYPGMEGGTALANLLFGASNPSGKLPFSIPKQEVDYPPFNPFTNHIEYGYYHGYTLFDKQGLAVAYPFGFGLSYSDFKYENLSILSPALTEDDTLQVTVDITNESTISGKEVTQLYIGFSQSTIDRPVKLLRGFQKNSLLGESQQTIELSVPVKELAWYNPETKTWEIEKMDYEVFV
ncbi:MAG: glycoside hydrolase family 3 C-terminal domain-containing protein, partial [Bacteroidota bacterium]